MKCQQRLAYLPIPTFCQLDEGHLACLAEHTPLLGDQPRERSVVILRRHAPPLCRVPDRLAPIGEALGWPDRTRGRGQREPKCVGTLQKNISQREHIRRPLQQLVLEWNPANSQPRGI